MAELYFHTPLNQITTHYSMMPPPPPGKNMGWGAKLRSQVMIGLWYLRFRSPLGGGGGAVFLSPTTHLKAHALPLYFHTVQNHLSIHRLLGPRDGLIIVNLTSRYTNGHFHSSQW
jgi:hypothetical protein